MSEPETENDSPRKMAKLGQRTLGVNGSGVKPPTRAMPISLRSVKFLNLSFC